MITAIDGNAVEGSNQLRNRIAATKPGARVTLTVRRNGAEKKLTATLDELPASTADGEEGAGESRGEAGALGLRIEPLPRDRARWG